MLALALGIGATTAIFAVVNGVLLRSLPYRDDGRLVNIWSFNTKENLPRNPAVAGQLPRLPEDRTRRSTGSKATSPSSRRRRCRSDAGTEITNSLFVTPNMFNMLGRSAALGRAFALGEDSGVIVLSDGYWRRRFGADPNIVGKTLTLSNQPFQVIGVMPPDFVFPYPGMLGPSGFTRVTQHRRVAADRLLGTDGSDQSHAQPPRARSCATCTGGARSAG